MWLFVLPLALLPLVFVGMVFSVQASAFAKRIHDPIGSLWANVTSRVFNTFLNLLTFMGFSRVSGA